MIQGYNFFGTKEIIQMLKDICLDIVDDGYIVEIYPDSEIRIKLLSIENKVARENKNFEPTFNITCKIFRGDPKLTHSPESLRILDIKFLNQTLEHIKSFMNDEGFDTRVDLINKRGLRMVFLSFHIKR